MWIGFVVDGVFFWLFMYRQFLRFGKINVIVEEGIAEGIFGLRGFYSV